MDCSLPGFSVHGIFQARVLEWGAIPFSRGSSRPRDQTRVSHIAGKRFALWATTEYTEEGNSNGNIISHILFSYLILVFYDLILVILSIIVFYKKYCNQLHFIFEEAEAKTG